MKIFITLLLLIDSLSQMGYGQTNPYGKPLMAPDKITDNLQHWQTYEGRYLNLEEDFIALSEKSAVTSKVYFFKKLMTGKYLPVKLISAKGAIYYQLYPLAESAAYKYGPGVQLHAYPAYQNVVQENRSFPAFKFTDINGIIYDSNNTKGKILVIKTWFIKCSACIAEMPVVNALADQYKSRKDILFISLALDSKQPLKQFLLNQKFNYAVVPDQNNYISKALRLNIYPTHLIVNKKGIITFVTNNTEPLYAALAKEAAL